MQYIATTDEVTEYIRDKYADSDFERGVETLELVDPEKPAHPKDRSDPFAMIQWECHIKEYHKRVEEYRNFRSKLYYLILSKCTEKLKHRLKSHEDFEASRDGISLLSIIKKLSFGLGEKRNKSRALLEVKERFYSLEQGNRSLGGYFRLFQNHVQQMDEVGVPIVDEVLAQSIALENDREEANDEDRQSARDQTLAICFLRGSNQYYRQFMEYYGQRGYMDVKYPPTLRDAYRQALTLQEIHNTRSH